MVHHGGKRYDAQQGPGGVCSVAGLLLSFVLELSGLVARLVGLALDEIGGIVDLAL